MDTIEWHQFRKLPYKVGFTLPCKGGYSWKNGDGEGEILDICTNPDVRRHGHVHILTRSGEVRLPFCCYSQEGVFKIFAFYGKLLPFWDSICLDQLRNIILGHDDVLNLPREITSEEKEVFESSEAMQRLVKLLFVKKFHQKL